MRKSTTLLLILSIIIFSACGEEKPKEKELDNIDIEKNPLGALMKMSKNIAENAEKMEESVKNKKDAKAIHYEELIKYLPVSINNYSVNKEAKGESIEMTGMSYSSAEVRFKNDNGDNINVTLIDYNAAYSMYSMATAMWSSGFKIDTSEEIAQSIKFRDNINGWESFQKKNNDASIIIGIGNRFLLSIDGENQENCAFIKGIAKSMDLEKLSNLD